MKIQIILLTVCVVAIFALPKGSGDEENQNEREQHYRGERPNENPLSNADESIHNLILLNETATEKSRHIWVRHENRRHWLKRGDGEEWHRRNNSIINEEEQAHQALTQEIEEKQDSPMLDENSQIERKHYRRHHHHKNRTTTTTPTSEMELGMPSQYSAFERKNHRHHHRHHHRNRTTTTTPSVYQRRK